MSFKLNYNHPISGTKPDGSRVDIVCKTNLTTEFFKNVGIVALPSDLEVFAGYDHGRPVVYNISRKGVKIATAGHKAIGKTLIAHGATPAPQTCDI